MNPKYLLTKDLPTATLRGNLGVAEPGHEFREEKSLVGSLLIQKLSLRRNRNLGAIRE